MSVHSTLTIRVDDIPPERWYDWEKGLERCADCLKNFDDMREEEMAADVDEGNYVPLQLFSDDRKRMLSLCWPCAEKRMGEADPGGRK